MQSPESGPEDGQERQEELDDNRSLLMGRLNENSVRALALNSLPGRALGIAFSRRVDDVDRQWWWRTRQQYVNEFIAPT